MGIGVKYIDYDKQIQYDTLSKAAIRNKIFVETLSEEMRILYVALTRAKEKLIITGISKDYQKESEKMIKQVERYAKCNGKINPILVKKYKKYLDWILLVYYYEKENSKNKIDFNIYNKQEAIKSFNKIEQEEIDVKQIFESNVTNKEKLEELENILNRSYINQLATTIPTKTSVTNIKQMAQENKKSAQAKNFENKENQEESKFENTEFPKPKFLKEEKEEKLTGAQKGTLVHLCLQRLDEKKNYDLNKINDLIKDLEIKQIITKKEAENINPFKILEFTKSDIWQELKQAKEIQKEKPFYINIPAKTVYEKDIEENILVQGIIDLYYIDKNDNLILVDYKTDYVEEGKEIELVEKYEKQLEIYQEALEGALNKKVIKKYIYSVYLGKKIEA
jgi:ATP-dependent helicase/nuclease subunit A